MTRANSKCGSAEQQHQKPEGDRRRLQGVAAMRCGSASLRAVTRGSIPQSQPRTLSASYRWIGTPMLRPISGKRSWTTWTVRRLKCSFQRPAKTARSPSVARPCCHPRFPCASGSTVGLVARWKPRKMKWAATFCRSGGRAMPSLGWTGRHRRSSSSTICRQMGLLLMKNSCARQSSTSWAHGKRKSHPHSRMQGVTPALRSSERRSCRRAFR
mmetsp:Transcript_9227/g.21628  ORF Transcript_9227/g.21628 Transcript_9227/m.21628 type:complete len:213 (+) Transcript_9227:1042-1680(+)